MINYARDTVFGRDENSPRYITTAKKIQYAVVVILGLMLVTSTFGTVGPGERGVKVRLNAVTGTVLDEGLYVKIPFIERVIKMNVQQQKIEAIANAASKDLQSVNATVALNYRLDSARVASIYQDVKKDYESIVISPVIQEAVKAGTAKFTAEELISKRDEAREAIKSNIVAKLAPQGYVLTEFNLVDFSFSTSFDQSIEKKVTAEQDALAAKNKLEQVKFEAEQKVEEAKGKAEAMRIEADALRSNPAVLELRALEVWNGVLPQVVGGATPFINLK